MANFSSVATPSDLYIGGEWVAPANGRYDDVNPSTEEILTQAPDASIEQVADAIGAARRAFDDGPWPRLSPEERSSCLKQLGNALLEESDGLFELAQTEWGCTSNERLVQVDGPAFMALRSAELAAAPVEERIDSFGAAGQALLRYEPLGVVSILTPWNFPHTLNVMKLGAALAAGNTVVLKPSPLTPLAALALARLIDERTDIPSGVVNVVTPSSLEASRLLTTEPRVDMVSFTGSSAVGREVMAAAATSMKRLLLECGGKSPNILLDDVEVTEELIDRILFEGCTLHAGQACILQSRLLVPHSLHDRVVEALRARAVEVRIGDPRDPETQMGPLISDRQRAQVEAHIARAVSEGAQIVAGGGRPRGLDVGFYLEPTVMTDVSPDSHLAQEEVFGPVLAVLTYETDDEAVRIANNSQYGLSGAIWAADTDRGLDVARQLRTGQVTINGCGPGDAPFGGFNQSGLGREGGTMGVRQYMEPKAIGAPA